ncbi:MAG: acetyl-CoA carboxylase biotin carboxyl carrier protein [Deltaproteobacteria bacterium]|nr:MAG: acetyl-CoA carboxylase biotin carboxyl carrier protein [Deltaproteobacteria bacterium]TMB28276.1 MAG: acetyl-CoA carboxylase biotin carboxyl carrier protein [Deltaproteobacteria bacterium]
MDVDKLKAILDALQGTDVSRLDWTDGTQRLTIRLGHPPAPTTSVHTMPMGAAGMAGQMGIPTPVSITPTPFASAPVAPPSPATPTPPAQQPAAADNTFTVNSPFVGTFYRSASPDNPPFVEVGSVVKKGEVLCIVEAMKLMNEIEAERPGRLVESLIQNGSPVEYGEALFRFEPA